MCRACGLEWCRNLLLEIIQARAPRALPIFKVLGRVPGLVWVLLAFFLIAGQLSPHFLTSRNLTEIVRQSAVLTVLACGTTVLLVAGLIDFSIGSSLSVVTVVAGRMLVNDYREWLVVIVAILLGMTLSGVQGLLVATFNVLPFVVSLGGITTYLGLALFLSNGTPFTTGDRMNWLGVDDFIGIPSAVLVMVGVVALYYLMMRATRVGRRIYSVGGSERAAYLAGVPIGRLKIGAYLIAGVTLGIAGLILMARTGTASPTIGNGYELRALAAVVIGGTTFTGGRGSVLGSVLGALLLTSINSLLALVNIPGSVQLMTTGVIVIFAAVLDQVLTQRLQRSGSYG